MIIYRGRLTSPGRLNRGGEARPHATIELPKRIKMEDDRRSNLTGATWRFPGERWLVVERVAVKGRRGFR